MSHRLVDLDPDVREMADKLLLRASSVGITLIVLGLMRDEDVT